MTRFKFTSKKQYLVGWDYINKIGVPYMCCPFQYIIEIDDTLIDFVDDPSIITKLKSLTK